MTNHRGKIRSFSESELAPSTGNPSEEASGTVLAALAVKVSDYNSIYIHNPAHNRVFAAFEELRLLGIATIGQRQLGVRNTAPTGSGKTTAAQAYAVSVAKKLGNPQNIRPVAIIPLNRNCTTRQLWTAVLDFYGDPYPNQRETEETLRKRAYRCFERFGTQLLIIDEVQHLVIGSGSRGDVTDSLKRVLDDGILPIAFCGTEDARALLMRNRQLSNRLMPPCDIRPLNPGDDIDRADFAGFVSRLDQAMLSKKLVRKLSNLAHPLTLACLFEISEGVIGRVTNLVRVAYSISFRRKADFVEICDLSAATSRWAVSQGMTKHDPFQFGVKMS